MNRCVVLFLIFFFITELSEGAKVILVHAEEVARMTDLQKNDFSLEYPGGSFSFIASDVVINVNCSSFLFSLNLILLLF